MKKYLNTILSLFKKYKHAVITLILFAVIGDIFFIGFKSDLIAFTILGLIIFFFKFYKINSKRIFIVCFIPIVSIFFNFLFSPFSFSIDKASIWLFLLIGTGIVWEFINKKNEAT